MIKVLHISFSDHYGGANISAMRLHECLEKKINSKFLVLNKKYLKRNVVTAKYSNFKYKIYNYISKILIFFFLNKKNSHSLNIFGLDLIDEINKINYDIIHLHWVNNEMISIKEISKINGKIIWTLHDMWPFCSTEHYTNNENYKNKLKNKKKILNISKIIFKLKEKYYPKNIILISPSEWMKKKSSKSKLFNKNKITVIRNPINENIWKYRYAIKNHTIKLAICGVNILNDKRKGFETLINSLRKFTKIYSFELNVIGSQDKIPFFKDIGFKIKNLGYIKNEIKISKYFNSFDCLLIPSVTDNLPNVGLEALASGLPIVCSTNGGLKEVIINKVNGVVIDDFNENNLGEVLQWVKKIKNKKNINKKISNIAHKKFGYNKISNLMVKKYNEIISSR